MGSVPPKHLSRSKVRRRRSHLALKPTNIKVCTSCKAPTLPHKACPACGVYRKAGE